MSELVPALHSNPVPVLSVKRARTFDIDPSSGTYKTSLTRSTIEVLQHEITTLRSQRHSLENSDFPAADKDNALSFIDSAIRERESRIEEFRVSGLGKSMLASVAANLVSNANSDSPVVQRIYVGNLHPDVREADLRRAFEHIGSIRQIELPLDPMTGKIKGYSFITFLTPQAAEQALAEMNAIPLLGRPLRVSKPTSAGGSAANNTLVNIALVQYGDHLLNQAIAQNPSVLGGPNANAAAIATAAAAIVLKLASTKQSYKVYVGNIPPGLDASHVINLFKPFGEIRVCSLLPSLDGSSVHRGFGFIEFEEESSALAAMKELNGLDLGTHKLKVNYNNASQAASSIATPFGASSTDINTPLQLTDAPTPKEEPRASPAGSVDAAAHKQAAPDSFPISSVSSAPSAVSVESTTTCIVALRNMVEKADLEDPELKDDVLEGAAAFGTVSQIEFISQEDSDVSPTGVTVFLKYASNAEAAAAVAGLNNRKFGDFVTRAGLYSQSSFESGQYDLPLL